MLPAANPRLREAASRGGKIAAARLSALERSNRASNAGNALLLARGLDYYSVLGKKSARLSGRRKSTA